MQSTNVSSDFSFEWDSKTYVMGILNITPDSFSGDGLWNTARVIEDAVRQAAVFADYGADVFDIGGESTRPGAETVSAEQEIERVIPVIKEISQSFDIPISIDTYKADIASAAIQAGAVIVNDVWGLKADPQMAEVVARADAPVILMHNRSKPNEAVIARGLGGRYVGVEYDDLIKDVKRELLESVEIALQHGVRKEKIILDPGIGFGKTVSQNLELLNKLDQIKTLGYPILLGPSRKSFIGYTLDLEPQERVEGTAATIAIGIDRGADIIRVHDVKEMVRIARMTDAIVR